MTKKTKEEQKEITCPLRVAKQGGREKLINLRSWEWIVVGLAGVILVVAIGLVFYLRKPETPQITNFQECVQAGSAVMESLPRQCRTQKGEIFVEEIEGEEGQKGKEGQEEEMCEDLCGDGICQEVVCLAVGCPCPETPESCPEDCSPSER